MVPILAPIQLINLLSILNIESRRFWFVPLKKQEIICLSSSVVMRRQTKTIDLSIWILSDVQIYKQQKSYRSLSDLNFFWTDRRKMIQMLSFHHKNNFIFVGCPKKIRPFDRWKCWTIFQNSSVPCPRNLKFYSESLAQILYRNSPVLSCPYYHQRSQTLWFF